MRLGPNGLKSLDTVLGVVAPAVTWGGAAPVRWLRSLHRRGDRDKTPLLVRPGGMGDLICLHLALLSLGVDPRSVRFVIEERSQPWADLHDLDYLLYAAPPKSALVAHLGRYETVINTEQRFGLALAFAEACRAVGGRLYAFSSCRGASLLPSAGLTAYEPRTSHEVTEFARLLSDALGLPKVAESVRSPPRQQPDDGSLLCCLAGSAVSSRAFAPEQWVRFIDAWAGSARVDLTFAPGDRHLAEQIQRRRAHPTKLVEGDFRCIVDAVARAHQLLTVDGGMVHVASFYGVPATVIFTSGQRAKWAPLAAGSRVATREDLPCQPCTLFGQVPPCPNAFACKKIPLIQLGSGTKNGKEKARC